MGSLLTGQKSQKTQPAALLRVNTSLQGVPLAWLLGGQQRLAGNLIWYGNFIAEPVKQGGGGKGGSFGGGGGGNYNYSASLMLAPCEGPDIAGIPFLYINGATAFLPQYSATPFLGTYAQTPWAFGDGNYYRGLCYVGLFDFPLGSSPTMPAINFEVLSTNANTIPGQPDGDFSVAWTKFFTDPLRGLGFPAYRMGNLTGWQAYCIATGLVGSPVIVSSVAASAWAGDVLKATNSNARWSAGLLTVVPYGDQAVTKGQLTQVTETHTVLNGGAYGVVTVSLPLQWASDGGVAYHGGLALAKVSGIPPVGGEYYVDQPGGPGLYLFNAGDIGASVDITYTYAAAASYQPNTTPVYSLDLDNFLPNQGSIGQGLAPGNSPLIVVRKPRDQMLNVVKVTYLDRENFYNPVTIEEKNEAAIQAFGRWRADSARQFDFFCLAAAAKQSAALMLAREQIARTFQWTSGKELILLDVMDLVEVSDPAQGIINQPVRIIEIQENEDFSLTFTAEEFTGTASAPLYDTQASTGFSPNFNEAPGDANPPILFEPTDQLAGALEVWAAVSGKVPSTWGGCNVWVSTDGNTYQQVGDPIFGAARMGVTTADFPSVGVNVTGQTVDQVNTLSVNLTESQGALSSGTTADALALNTPCYVGPQYGGGEVLAYQTATLTSAYNYGLTYLVRGAYGTEDQIADHPIGSYFARLDATIAKIPFNQNQIGQTIYIKLQGFNPYEGGLQDLSECAPYSYVIQGTALASPLPNVANLRTVFNNQTGFTDLDWDQITDFRSGILYEIRSGSSWADGVILGQPAHPPFTIPGPGTYWVSAYCQPVAGLQVYSETPQEAVITGAVITQYEVLTIDLAAAHWPGTFSGSVGLDSVNNAIRTAGGGNILTDPNILTTPDILNYGGEATGGGYYLPTGALLNVGYIANISVSIKYQLTGVAVGANILTIANILTTPDILGSASTQYVVGYPLIEQATTATLGVPNFGSFQKFSPGAYQAQWLNFAFYLQSIDVNTIGYNLQFAITATIPARIDQYAVTTSASGTVAVTFQPQGASSPQPFNGGTGAGNTPVVQVTIGNAQQGDTVVISGKTVSGLNVEVLNSGSPVVRNIELVVQGY